MAFNRSLKDPLACFSNEVRFRMMSEGNSARKKQVEPAITCLKKEPEDLVTRTVTQIVGTIAKKHPILNNSRLEILEPIALEKVKSEFERAKKNKMLLTARDIENLQT